MIEIRNVSQFFGSFKALDQVTLSIPKGTIHALIGENGAGKTTLAKIIANKLFPSEGKVDFTEGQNNSVGMIYQHFSLVDSLTVLENWSLFTHTPPVNARKKFFETLKKLGMDFKPDMKVEDLHLAAKQKLEIFNQLSQDKETIILDEPTAVLSPQEIKKLLQELIRLKSEGRTLVLITHKLKEVLSVCDGVSVLRKGQHVWSGSCKGMSVEKLAETMVGRHISFERRQLQRQSANQELLNFSALTLKRGEQVVVDNLNLQIAAGEIVGIVGVDGNGQESLVEFLTEPKGATKRAAGTWTFLGKERPAYGSLRDLGWGVLPEDRPRDSYLLDGTLAENFFLGTRLRSLFSPIAWGRNRQVLQNEIKRYSISAGSPDNKGRTLSGGNQQKLVIAREMNINPKFILALHPSRGVDIGSQEFIHEEILKAAERGVGVLLISSELDETLKLSDRIVVIYKGQIKGELQRQSFNEEQIGHWMVGANA